MVLLSAAGNFCQPPVKKYGYAVYAYVKVIYRSLSNGFNVSRR